MPILTLAGRHGVADNLFLAMKPKADNLQGMIAEASGHFVPEEAPAFLLEQIFRFFAPDSEPVPNSQLLP